MFNLEENMEYLNDSQFIQEVHEQQVKSHYLKVELLDFNENPIREIQGECVSGSLSLNGSSSVRRTCSFGIAAKEEVIDITNIDNLISINKKFRLYVGYSNDVNKSYPKIVWFPLGVFVITGASTSHSLGNFVINISAKDKMCLLNGEVSGRLAAPVSLHEKLIRNEDGTTTVLQTHLYEIIREAVMHLGEEDPGKIIINDVPLNAKKVLRYKGKESIFFSENGNEVDSSVAGAREIKPGDLAGYDYIDFVYPGELIKQANEPITSILDSIKNVLGNYEYFYDINGNFVFQEIKNYLKTSYTPITELSGGDYEVDLSSSHIAYSFKNSNMISSYSNTPNYQNIRNDFVVWGNRKTTEGVEIPIRYHVAIDDVPTVPSEYGNIPWQVFLYKYGQNSQNLGLDPGYYYRELQNEIPKIYDLEGNKWKDIDSASMDYFLDFIDTNSEIGKFSVKSIGRRTVAQVDKDVTMLYRPSTPDYVILEKNNPDNVETIQHLNKIGQKFIVVESRKLYENAAVGKDAFSVIRDLIFKHTTYSETINVSSLPLYFLEPNIRIEVEDSRSNIYGEYMINSITLPLTYEGSMSISAIRANTRL